MTLRLLTGHLLEFLTLKGGCTCENTTLLEITCHGSFIVTAQAVLYLYCSHARRSVFLFSVVFSSIQSVNLGHAGADPGILEKGGSFV